MTFLLAHIDTPSHGNFIEDEQKATAGGTYVVPTLGLDDGTPLFSYLGWFLSYITPHDISVELLKDAFHARLSVLELIFEALKIESGFICLIALFIILSLIPLLTVIVWSCSKPPIVAPVRRRSLDDDEGTPTADTLIALEESNDANLHCRRILQFFLHLFAMLLLAAITTMFLTNELVSHAIHQAPEVVKSSFQDSEQFSRSAYRDIAFNVHEGVSVAIERIKIDLENVDKLLGEPIQKDLESYTGIKTTMETILGICSANYEIIHRVQLLQDSLAQAISISKEATKGIEEFRIQLAVLQRQCSSRDKPLCDTLRLRGFEDNGILNTFIRLQGDPNVLKMQNLGDYHSNNVYMNISTELKSVQLKFRDFPSEIKQNISKDLKNIEDLLTKMHETVLTSTNKLTQTVDALIDRVDVAWSHASPLFDQLRDTSHFIWGISLNTALATLVITLVLYGAYFLGITHEERAAKVMFVISAVLISIAGIGLAAFTTFIMLLGGHGEVFLCRPLYDAPNFLVFGKFFDKPGLVYANETTDGIIGDLLQLPDDDFIANFTVINATLASAINRCERNEATYEVFQLARLLNASLVADVYEYNDLENAIEKIFVSATSFSSLTEPLERIFDYMFLNSDINFNGYRLELSQPTPEKDLSTFIDQMQRVSIQIQEVATSSRMSTLGNRARRLQSTTLQPMEQIRNDILFHLTALQLQKEPWAEMVNQSLIHLRTTQYFLNQDSADICLNRSVSFKTRILSHLISNRRQLLLSLQDHLAPCRPLYDIFDANRQLICGHIIDPLNGLWFSSFLCLCLWAILTPIALGLASIYNQMSSSRSVSRSNSHQTPIESTIISEQSNWGSRPPQRQSVRSSRSEQANFTFEEAEAGQPEPEEEVEGPQQRNGIRRDVTFSE